MLTANSFLKGKPHKCCGKDPQRPSMQYLYFKDGFVYATDATVLVKQNLLGCHDIPVEMHTLLDGKLLHAENAEALAVCNFFEFQDDKIIGHKKGSKTKVLADLELEENVGKYPNINAVIPTGERGSVSRFALNPKLLVQIQSAAVSIDKAAANTRLNFYGETRSAVVEFAGFDISEQSALIMPVRFN